MASLAELYLPLVAVIQFTLAGVVVWLGGRSTRSWLAAVILVANATQGLMVMAFQMADTLGKPWLHEAIGAATGLTALFWVAITEYVIAGAVGLLAISLVRPLRRHTTLTGLFLVTLLLPYLAALLLPGAERVRYTLMAAPSAAFFAIAFVVTCTYALPHVLRTPSTTARAHGMLVLAALLVPMAQQHVWYFFGPLDGHPPTRASEILEQWGIGIVSVVVLAWVFYRLVDAYARQRYRPALWLALAVLGSLVFAFVRKYIDLQNHAGEWIPASTQVFAQMVRPSLLLLAFGRFEFVRLPRAAWRPLAIGSSLLVGFSMFMVVQLIAYGNPYRTSTLAPVPVFVGLALGVTVAGAAMPPLLRAIDRTALEEEAGGRGQRLERYKAALLAGDPDLARLREQLGIHRHEHEAMQHVLAGNLVIPEVAARGLRVGDHLEGYTVTAPLGSGGQGIVVRAEDAAGRQVVIKQVHDAWAQNAKGRVEALHREAAAGTGVREVIENPFAAYLVRDFVPGVPLPQAGAVNAARLHAELAEQVQDLHRRGWVHGDIKPSNVIITPDGAAVLIDEGAASRLDATRTIAYVSLAVAAPEQLRGENTPASDVYQLGRLLEPYATTKGMRDWVSRAVRVDPAGRPPVL